MSMTREEAIERIKDIKDSAWGYHIGGEVLGIPYDEFCEIMDTAISALRPVSREQVEKVWRGEWIIQQDEHKEYIKKCSKCGFPISGWWGADKFCANCGAPMTDEAVDMVMERLEAMKDGKDD